jgi:hypothetical protein
MEMVMQSDSRTRRRDALVVVIAGLLLQLSSSAQALVINGTHSAVNDFSYFLGTSGENLTFGLNFQGRETVQYNYSANVAVEKLAPTKVRSGELFNVVPYLSLAGTPSFAAQSQPENGLSYSTRFGVSVYVPIDGLPDINFSASLPIPDVDVDDIIIDAEGAGNLVTTGTTFTDNGFGIFRLDTNEASTPAWSISADLISFLAYAGVPGAGFIDTFGIDLGLELGMPILREDAFALTSYSFDGADSSGAIDVSVSGDVGDTVAYTYNTFLNYSLAFISEYDYGLTAGLYFDAPLIDPYYFLGGPESTEFAEFDVANKVHRVNGRVPVTLSGTVEISGCPDLKVGDPDRPGQFIEIPDPECDIRLFAKPNIATEEFFSPGRSFDAFPALQKWEEGTPQAEELRALYIRALPEPSGLSLLALAALALGVARRIPSPRPLPDNRSRWGQTPGSDPTAGCIRGRNPGAASASLTAARLSRMIGAVNQ